MRCCSSSRTDSKRERPAAKALGLTQTTFHWLLKGTGPGGSRRRMRHKVYLHVRGGIELSFRGRERSELLRQFTKSMITEQGEQVRRDYTGWKVREYERLQPKCSKLLLTLWKHADYRPQIEKFLRDTTGVKDKPKWTWTNLRLLLALYRAIEPLAAAKATWGVERSWQELHETNKLRSFLRASLKREILLWRRGGYLARINEVRPQKEAAPPEEPWDIPIPDDIERSTPAEDFTDLLKPPPIPYRGSRARTESPTNPRYHGPVLDAAEDEPAKRASEDLGDDDDIPVERPPAQEHFDAGE